VVTGVTLSRNFGQLAAILAGYEQAAGDAVVTISADLQDPTSLIPEMFRRWREGMEIVIAHRSDRQDAWSASLASRFAYSVARAANDKMPPGGFDFLLMSRRAMTTLLSFRGRHRFFQGDVLWMGYPTASRAGPCRASSSTSSTWWWTRHTCRSGRCPRSASSRRSSASATPR
jgi:dolichol-phosphate mannosyltransferase